MVYPLAADFTVSLGTADVIKFEIRLNSTTGTPIYSGTAYKEPGETYNIIRINDICADYVDPIALEDLHTSEWVNYTPPTFYVMKQNADLTWSEVGHYTFIPNWLGTTPGTSLNDNILPVVTYNQPIYICGKYQSIVVEASYKDGSYETVTYTCASGPDIYGGRGIYPDDFDQNVLVSLNILGTDYLIDYCHTDNLIYRNALGGWDSLVMEGGVIAESDAITRHTFETGSHRELVDFANEMEKSFTFKTGWLTDAQAAKLQQHLLTSPEVYWFHEGENIKRIVLTNADAPVKTFRNQGGHLVSYEITARLAELSMRR